MRNFINSIWVTFLTKVFAVSVIIAQKSAESLIKAKNLNPNPPTLKDKLENMLDDAWNGQSNNSSEELVKYRAKITRNRTLTQQLRKNGYVGAIGISVPKAHRLSADNLNDLLIKINERSKNEHL